MTSENNHTGSPKEPLTISTEELNKLPKETLPLTPIVLSGESRSKEIAAACLKLRAKGTVGFDTETKPSFKKGINYPVALLQLATDEIVVLVRLTQVKEFGEAKWLPLRRLLASPKVLKTGVGIHDDALGLSKDHGLVTNTTLDLRSLAQADGMDVLSLSKIYSLLFGKRLAKGQRLSDWERPELTPAQKQYAGLDAYAGYMIYRRLEHLATPGMVTKRLHSKARCSKPRNNNGLSLHHHPNKSEERQ